jgi:hypothetical protein
MIFENAKGRYVRALKINLASSKWELTHGLQNSSYSKTLSTSGVDGCEASTKNHVENKPTFEETYGIVT